MPELVPLRSLYRGQVAEVGQIIGDDEQIQRLGELGLRAGARVEVLRSGAPCIIRINDSKLCFRDDETLRVMVRIRMSA